MYDNYFVMKCRFQLGLLFHFCCIILYFKCLSKCYFGLTT